MDTEHNTESTIYSECFTYSTPHNLIYTTKHLKSHYTAIFHTTVSHHILLFTTPFCPLYSPHHTHSTSHNPKMLYTLLHTQNCPIHQNIYATPPCFTSQSMCVISFVCVVRKMLNEVFKCVFVISRIHCAQVVYIFCWSHPEILPHHITTFHKVPLYITVLHHTTTLHITHHFTHHFHITPHFTSHHHTIQNHTTFHTTFHITPLHRIPCHVTTSHQNITYHNTFCITSHHNIPCHTTFYVT